MITFASLFLGLILGPQTVELAVGEEVARVELYLDGASVGEADGPPWRIPCDFGAELAPRELVAVAFDEEDVEIDRERQWINLPRAPAEVGIVLDGGQDGRAQVARLTWESITASEPRSVSASFDGQPLAVTDPQSIELPPHDPAQLHLLRVEVDFSEAVSSVAEVVFGGTYADRVDSELTAVAVTVAGRRDELTVPALAGTLTGRGAPLEVVAVEAAGAEVVVVRDEGAVAPLARTERALRRIRTGAGAERLRGGWLRQAMPLGKDQRLRMLWPYPEVQEGISHRFALFPSSPEFGYRDAGVYWLITRLAPRKAAGARQKLADAVAVAGLAAAARKRPRVVVLVLGQRPQDDSQLAPPVARRYLERLGVPLVVWSAHPQPGDEVAAWGETVDISTASKIDRAVRDLVRYLERQRIVWVRGIHRPQDIALAHGAGGLELVR